MMKYILIGLMFINYACGQELDPLGWSGVTVISDTTTNIYVNSNAASDTGDGLSFANAKKSITGGLSLVNAPTDSIFLYGTFDSSYTINKQCSIVAYDYNNKPTIDGSKLISNWNQGYTSTQDTLGLFPGYNEQITVAAMDREIPSGMSGILKAIIIRGGTSNSPVLKVGIGMRNGNNITILDSTFGTSTGLTSGVDNYIPITNGRFLSTDTFRVVIAFAGWPSNFDKGLNKPADTSFAYGIYANYTWYNNWTAGSHAVIDTTTWSFDYHYGTPDSSAVGLVLETQTGSNNVYYAIYADTVYEVFFNDTLGYYNTDKSLVDTLRNWHYSNDSLYIFATVPSDTSTIRAVVRDGIIIQNKVNISGLDIEKTRYAIKPEATDSIEISANYLKQNIYGFIDSSAHKIFLHNNIFDENENNLKAVNNSLIYIWNNDFKSSNFTSSEVVTTNIQTINSKVDILNNIMYLESTPVGSIDSITNINNLDYEAAVYWVGGGGRYWTIDSVAYDSLPQLQSATIYGDSSLNIQEWKDYPYDSLYFTDMWNGDFRLKADSTQSPAVNKGKNLTQIKKDFYNSHTPDGRMDMGAIESYVSPNPLAPFNLVATIGVTDSSHLTWEYYAEPDLKSSIIFRNNIPIDTIPVSNSYYDHPSRSSQINIPEVLQISASNIAQSSATISFYIKPGNDTTYYRVRYGIGSFTNYYPASDSTIVFTFIPEATTYRIKTLDSTNYLSNGSNSANLQYDSLIYISINLTGLTSGQNYIADATASNDLGWVNSNDISFNTLSSGSTNEITFEPIDSTLYYVGFVNLYDSIPGTRIYYTTNGSTPDSTSNQYYQPIELKGTTTIKAIGYRPNWTISSVFSKTYTFAATQSSTFNLSATYNYIEAEATNDYPDGFVPRPMYYQASNGVYMKMSREHYYTSNYLQFAVVPSTTTNYAVWARVSTDGGFACIFRATIDGTNTQYINSVSDLNANNNWQWKWVQVYSSVSLTSGNTYVFNFTYNWDPTHFDKFLITSDLTFTPPDLDLISPNAHERYTVNSNQDIIWKEVGDCDSVKIEYSINNGTTWNNIVTSTPNDGLYNWNVGSTESSQALIKITGLGSKSGTLIEVSDGKFNIVSSGNLNPYLNSSTFAFPISNAQSRIGIDDWWSKGIDRTTYLNDIVAKSLETPWYTSFKDGTSIGYDAYGDIPDSEAVAIFRQHNTYTPFSPVGNIRGMYQSSGEGEGWIGATTSSVSNFSALGYWLRSTTTTDPIYATGESGRRAVYFGASGFPDWVYQRCKLFMDAGITGIQYDSFGFDMVDGMNNKWRDNLNNSIAILNPATGAKYKEKEWYADFHRLLYEVNRKLEANYGVKFPGDFNNTARQPSSFWELKHNMFFKWYDLESTIGLGVDPNTNYTSPADMHFQFVNNGAVEWEANFVSTLGANNVGYNFTTYGYLTADMVCVDGSSSNGLHPYFDQTGNSALLYQLTMLLMGYHPDLKCSEYLQGSSNRDWAGYANLQRARFVPKGKFYRVAPGLLKREFVDAIVYINGGSTSQGEALGGSYYYLQDDGTWSTGTVTSFTLAPGHGAIFVQNKTYTGGQ